MGTTTDFFDPSARNSRARQAVAVELMRELSRYKDPDELYKVFSRRMTQLYPTTRQVTVSRRGLERPNFRVTRFNLWKEQSNPWRDGEKLPVQSGGLIGELAYEEQPRVIGELALEPGDPAGQYFQGQRSLLSIPLFENGVATATVMVAREEANAFPPEQVPELVWLSNFFARATQTLVLSQRLQEAYDDADYELRTVAEMQRCLLPAEVPLVEGLDVAVHYRAANRAGGDYYDYFPLPDGKLGILVADVSGHGTPASVLMAITHTLSHARNVPLARPGEFLAYLNAHLARKYTLTTGNFVTAVYAVFDPVGGTVTYANAGHAPSRARIGAMREFGPLDQVRRLPLGVTHRTVGPYPEQTIDLHPGDSFALFTDGITDAVNAQGESFGTDRLDELLSQAESTAGETVARLVEAMEEFMGSTLGQDDRTLVLVKCEESLAGAKETAFAQSAESE
jgi:sigma-B regulation protein RsbU (phosphoserine phosphatase)